MNWERIESARTRARFLLAIPWLVIAFLVFALGGRSSSGSLRAASNRADSRGRAGDTDRHPPAGGRGFRSASSGTSGCGGSTARPRGSRGPTGASTTTDQAHVLRASRFREIPDTPLGQSLRRSGHEGRIEFALLVGRSPRRSPCWRSSSWRGTAIEPGPDWEPEGSRATLRHRPDCHS